VSDKEGSDEEYKDAVEAEEGSSSSP